MSFGSFFPPTILDNFKLKCIAKFISLELLNGKPGLKVKEIIFLHYFAKNFCQLFHKLPLTPRLQCMFSLKKN